MSKSLVSLVFTKDPSTKNYFTLCFLYLAGCQGCAGGLAHDTAKETSTIIMINFFIEW